MSFLAKKTFPLFCFGNILMSTCAARPKSLSSSDGASMFCYLFEDKVSSEAATCSIRMIYQSNMKDVNAYLFAKQVCMENERFQIFGDSKLEAL